MPRKQGGSSEAAGILDGGLEGGTRPFVVAAEKTRMPMIFTDATTSTNPLIFANDAFLELTGYTRDAALALSLDDLIGNAIYGKARSGIWSALEKGAEGTWALHCRGANDREIYAAAFLSPVRDEAGNVIQNFLSFVEIGGHLDRLVAEHNELHTIYQQAPGFIAITKGPDHRITFANVSYKRFVGRDNVEGLTVAEALPEIADQGFVAILDQVFETGEPFVARDAAMDFVDRATGETERRYADFVYQPVRSVDGTITGLFCEGYDATARHLAADHLAALQSDMIHVSRANAMGTMAITLAHELNQPLSAIVNFAEGGRRLANQAEPNGSALADALSGISSAAHRAGEIIRNLRDLTTRRATARSTFGLQAACGECIRLVKAVAHPSVVIVDKMPGGLLVSGDRIQVQQVLINLLRNACEAVQESELQLVTAAAFEAGGQVIISVADTGPGVSITAAQSIFSFVESIKECGMGIGLSISRTIVDAHGGKIWLENSDSAGTEIRFSLPLDPADAEGITP